MPAVKKNLFYFVDYRGASADAGSAPWAGADPDFLSLLHGRGIIFVTKGAVFFTGLPMICVQAQPVPGKFLLLTLLQIEQTFAIMK